MKLLIADTKFPAGHRNLNKHLLDILSQNESIDELKVLNSHTFYDKGISNKIRYYTISILKSKRAYWDYCCQFLTALLVIGKCLFIRYDKIVFFTFDTLAFSLLRWGIFKPVYLFHHNNTDHLQNKYKLFFFKTYMNSVNHIVFADFIKEYLIRLGVEEKRIFIISHPLPEIRPAVTITKKKYIALGHANDEKLICELINYEKQTHILENNNVQIVIRTGISYEKLPSSLILINHYLSQEEYEYYYSTANGVLILYPVHFKNRFSGALLDAFCNRKIVIGKEDVPVVNYFSGKYPKCCITFQKVGDLFDKLSAMDINAFDEQTFDSFLQVHSDEVIRRQLNEILF